MSLISARSQLELPESLRGQLHDFRRRLWTIKLVEASCGAAGGVLLAFLLLFVLDRLVDTPAGWRVAIFAVAMFGCAAVPLALHRWVWRQRRLEQLARLLSRKYPGIGDQLLGIIELVRSESEQARSLALCQAAIRQVAETARRQDFRDAVPHPRHRRQALLAGLAAAAAVGVFALYPAAATNAWTRFLLPWRDTPRYTFADVEPLPDPLVVAHGESFTVALRLREQTQSRPAQAEIRVGGQRPLTASLQDGRYVFEVPAQIEPALLRVRIGDFRDQVRIEPTLRPELTSVLANVTLPEYLGRGQPVTSDVRGGAISLVKGSRATFVATASRALSAARVDGQPQAPTGQRVTSPAVPVDDSRQLEFRWQDLFGLAGKEPFTLSITGRDDEAPSLACEDLPRQKVVLDSEVLNFQVKAQDDFGVRHVGIEWQGIDTATIKSPAKGERILAAGDHEREVLDLAGTFSAASLGIEPQPIQVRLFAEDFYPGRGRVYSPMYTLYVLDPEQHAIWLTEMLSRWHRQSLEVRDRELQLHETNRQLRDLPTAELDQPETRRQIETQATAERSNGRRLAGLVDAGEDLVRQAMRNPEFGVGHLEKWAEMLQILKDISANRMPSVADLLKQAAQSPQLAASQPDRSPPSAGQVRSTGSSTPGAQPEEQKRQSVQVPSIADIESSQGNSLTPSPEETTASKPSASPSLGLPTTTLLGAAKRGDTCPAGEKVEEAVVRQQDLLAEFEKIADELNRVLANLEGSTLVKRLKAASRTQYRIADRLVDQLNDGFGVPASAVKEPHAAVFTELATQEAKSSGEVSTIMDDMQSYFERRRFLQFKTVLDDMRQQDVIGGLRQLGDDLRKENGLSIAQCEYWSDTLDRWAEDLVDPASGGT